MKKLLISIVAFSLFVNAWSQINSPGKQKFSGPINTVFDEKKLAFVYPTSDNDTITMNSIRKYMSEVFNSLKNEENIMLPDSSALSRPLSDYGLLVYGSIESNLFLKHYKSSFPFKIENNTIYADKEYKDKNTRFITCLPNPQNPMKGMIIYTGITNKNIVGINGVYHGPTDFVVSISPTGDNLNTLYSEKDNLSQGNYNKTDGKWKFAK
jgi:hypothetical protein